MNWAKLGPAAIAVVLSAAAHAEPANSDLWIGFQNSENGFLLDEDTGDTWMTGSCLKPLARSEAAGEVWTSRTVEMVSVGRSMALLDQTFRLDTSSIAPTIIVESAGRGGAQTFAAVIDRNCSTGGTCARLVASQQVCQG